MNRAQTQKELEALRQTIADGCPYGSNAWIKRIVYRLGLEAAMRGRGRPSRARYKYDCALAFPSASTEIGRMPPPGNKLPSWAVWSVLAYPSYAAHFRSVIHELQSSLQCRRSAVNVHEAHLLKPCAAKIRTIDTVVLEFGTFQDRIPEGCVAQVSISQTCTEKIGEREVSIIEPEAATFSSCEIALVELGFAQVGIGKKNSVKIGMC